MKDKNKAQAWVRFVVMRHAIGLGLTTGIAIPLLNAYIRPAPGYDVLQALAFSVPFFVTAWSLFGVYMWRKDGQKTDR